MSVRDVYERNIRPLSPLDRLRLASLILDELTSSQGAGLDIRDDWSEEDMRDLAAYSLQSAGEADSDEQPASASK